MHILNTPSIIFFYQNFLNILDLNHRCLVCQSKHRLQPLKCLCRENLLSQFWSSLFGVNKKKLLTDQNKRCKTKQYSYSKTHILDLGMTVGLLRLDSYTVPFPANCAGEAANRFQGVAGCCVFGLQYLRLSLSQN